MKKTLLLVVSLLSVGVTTINAGLTYKDIMLVEELDKKTHLIDFIIDKIEEKNQVEEVDFIDFLIGEVRKKKQGEKSNGEEIVLLRYFLKKDITAGYFYPERISPCVMLSAVEVTENMLIAEFSQWNEDAQEEWNIIKNMVNHSEECELYS